MVSDGLAASLAAHEIDVVATATDGRDALNLAELARPHVAVLDASLSPFSAKEMARALASSAGARIVVLSSGWGAVEELETMHPHVQGFVPLTEPAHLLADTIHAVARGEWRLPSERHRAARAANVFSSSGEVVLLSGKQLQVLELIVRGLTSQEIAEHLGIHIRTAENHRTMVMRKLGVRNVVQLVRFAIRRGLVNP